MKKGHFCYRKYDNTKFFIDKIHCRCCNNFLKEDQSQIFCNECSEYLAQCIYKNWRYDDDGWRYICCKQWTIINKSYTKCECAKEIKLCQTHRVCIKCGKKRCNYC